MSDIATCALDGAYLKGIGGTLCCGIGVGVVDRVIQCYVTRGTIYGN